MAGAKRGRLEAILTLSSSTITFDDGASLAQVVTVPAGDYTITSLVAFLVANVVGGGNWSITFSSGESGTGRITISTTDTPFSVTWSNTNVRSLMGFSADISAVSSAQTGTHARCCWLPDTVKWTPHGDDNGNGNAATRRSSARDQISPTGGVKTLAGSSLYDFRGIRWEGVTRARTKIIGESVTNESFERFWGDAYLGDFALATAGSKIRFYWDADTATYTDVRMVGMRDFDPDKIQQNWVGRYTIVIPRLVKV